MKKKKSVSKTFWYGWLHSLNGYDEACVASRGQNYKLLLAKNEGFVMQRIMEQWNLASAITCGSFSPPFSDTPTKQNGLRSSFKALERPYNFQCWLTNVHQNECV